VRKRDTTLFSKLADRIVIVLISLCILTGAFSTSRGGPRSNPALVYCPLAKQWVPRHVAPQVSAADPLNYLCAADKSKLRFYRIVARQMISSGTYLTRSQVESTFLDFTISGNDAMIRLTFPNDHPKRDKITAAASRSVLSLTRDGIEISCPYAAVELPLPSPQSLASADNFARIPPLGLRRVSNAIRLRGPPSFIS
jgi:hypothetical protein